MGIVHMSTAVVSYCTMLLYEYEGKGTREGFQVVFSSLLFVLGGVFRLAHLPPVPCCQVLLHLVPGIQRLWFASPDTIAYARLRTTVVRLHCNCDTLPTKNFVLLNLRSNRLVEAPLPLFCSCSIPGFCPSSEFSD